MKIDVIGAGGIGVAMAVALADAGLDITIIENNSLKLTAMQRDGVAVSGHGHRKIPVTTFHDWHPDSEAIILLCTKTYNNGAILKRLLDSNHPKMRLIPVQNGYDRELENYGHAGEAIASFVSECDRDRAVTTITRPGDLHIGARRELMPGEQNEFHRTIDELVTALASTNLFSTHKVADIRPFKATKLMYNAAISPLAASAGVDNAELLANPLARRHFFGLLLENHAILKQAGLAFAKIGPFHPDTVVRILHTPGLATLLGRFFKPSLRGTYCSMAPDIGSEHTEIDAYNGHLVKLAGDFPCPLNRAAVQLIKQMTEQRQSPGPDQLNVFNQLLQEQA
ncbi:MAG: 2-dehydropantoate 2-reductase N-terminal domain-containing protein [Gammaproteobacteria bacterium]|nr:2-dehydropantoate 2-reductase N-terminal domain-containing protein [Gammaproteobacteria bacterium]